MAGPSQVQTPAAAGSGKPQPQVGPTERRDEPPGEKSQRLDQREAVDVEQKAGVDRFQRLHSQNIDNDV